MPSQKEFELAAQRYLASLPLEHFMEAGPQSTQREITLESLALVRPLWPEFRVLNEMCLQYVHEGEIKHVVPDNMIVLSSKDLGTIGSLPLPQENVQPILALEYVSPSSTRKDYHDNFVRYEQDLRIPYYLVFYPEKQDLRLFRLNGESYEKLSVNEQGRFPIAELNLEVALHERWVRFWFSGDLLPLPAELQSTVDQLKARIQEAEQLAQQEKTRADDLEAEVGRLRALLQAKNGAKGNGGLGSNP